MAVLHSLIKKMKVEQMYAGCLATGAYYIESKGAGAILDFQQPILVVADEGREEEVITRLSRVGYANAIGFLKGRIEAWRAAGKEIDSIKAVSAEEFANLEHHQGISVFDVRGATEYKAAHVEGCFDTIKENPDVKLESGVNA